MTETKPRELGTAMRLLVDLGPLVVFFVANARYGVFVGTGAFIIAFLAGMAISLIATHRVSKLQLFSGFLVVVMGGLTLWLHNETFIKIKPTLYYSVIAALLCFGLATGRPLLKSVLGSAYPGLDQTGWDKLTRNWAIFFFAMALTNEAVWRSVTTDQWISFKLWIALPATFLFALANVPMLMRHGLSAEEATLKEISPE